MFQMTIPASDPELLPFDDIEMNQGFSLLQNSAEFRDGKHRIPTPDKEALLSLSNSFNKHRLKKHQQLLDDISKRCREQEIMDMSDSITKKCKISRFEEKPAPATAYKELTFYRTNTMALVRQSAEPPTESTEQSQPYEQSGYPYKRQHQQHQSSNLDLEASELHGRGDRKPLFERSNTYFPPRQVKKILRKGMSPHRSFAIGYQKGVTPTDRTSRERIVQRVKINGPIQMELYKHQKYDQLSPLVLPRINDTDRLEEFFMSKKVKLGPKTRSIILSSVSSTGAQLHVPKTRFRLKEAASTGHVTATPNSLMDIADKEIPQTAPVEWAAEPKNNEI